jgi:hypothetical protein
MAAIFQMTRATAAIRRPGDLTPAGPPTTAQSPLRASAQAGTLARTPAKCTTTTHETGEGKGTLIGEQAPDRLRVWRIDGRDRHVNWWDWTEGKKGAEAFTAMTGSPMSPPPQAAAASAGPHGKTATGTSLKGTSRMPRIVSLAKRRDTCHPN